MQCIEPRTAGGFLAHFGYVNPNNVVVSDVAENIFEPLTANGQQPTDFDPGTHDDVFQVQSDGPALTWHLTGHQVTATTASPHCQGSITILKILNPARDPGGFNLEIDGQVAGGAAAVGDGGNTGTIAVDTGRHTVGESAAGSTVLTDYDVQITCSTATTTVAEGNGPTLAVPVGKGQAVACVITNTHKFANTITPELECVVFQNGAPSSAIWGYSNPNVFPVTVPIGATNGFSPAPVDRGQPLVFEPGHLIGAFQTPFLGAASLAWTVGNRTVQANSASTRCSATLVLNKVSVPANDPGFFNLQINGQTWAIGGNGTTTGPITVGVGEGPSAKRPALEPLCRLRLDGHVQSQRRCRGVIPGTKVDGAVGQGDVVVCTFTNTRKPTAPIVPRSTTATPASAAAAAAAAGT